MISFSAIAVPGHIPGSNDRADTARSDRRISTGMLVSALRERFKRGRSRPGAFSSCHPAAAAVSEVKCTVTVMRAYRRASSLHFTYFFANIALLLEPGGRNCSVAFDVDSTEDGRTDR
jgi:hypothetical protein